jgi:hypothetical protein
VGLKQIPEDAASQRYSWAYPVVDSAIRTGLDEFISSSKFRPEHMQESSAFAHLLFSPIMGVW